MGIKHLQDQAVLLRRDYIRKGQSRIHIENAPDFPPFKGKRRKGKEMEGMERREGRRERRTNLMKEGEKEGRGDEGMECQT